MSNTIGLSIEIDANLKKEAELVMEQYGLNPTTAITMFYKQIARERSIPLSLSLSKLDVELGRAVAASQEERSEGFIGYPALQVADDMDAIIKGRMVKMSIRHNLAPGMVIIPRRDTIG